MALDLKDFKAQYPFPWRDIVHPNGLIQIIDAEGKEVGLTTMIAFAIQLTHKLNK